jgi:uncharacterized membrane protein
MFHAMWTFVAGFVAFVVIDGFWLGVAMRHFYRRQLSPIARMSKGKLAPIWPAAVLVYGLLALGIMALAVPHAGGAPFGAGLSGATLGLVIYGVYNLTNFATLAAWQPAMTVVDTAWGTILCGAVAVIVAAVGPWIP